MEATAVERAASAHVASVVEAVLEAGRSSSFGGASGVLRKLAALCHADGCVLWLWTEQGPPDERQLFAAAEWFRSSESLSFHYLSNDSPTARQALAGEAVNFAVSPYLGREEVDLDARVAGALGIKSYCTIPVRWPDMEANLPAAGMVNFYRCGPVPFSDAEFELAKRLACLVLQLLTDVSNRSGFAALRSVADELRQARPASSEQTEVFSGWFRHTLQKIVELLGKEFNCVETSVYLEHPERTGRIELVAKEWPWANKQREIYEPGVGLTGYCFQKGVPIRIFDLRRFERDLASIQEEYAGIGWTKAFDLDKPVKGQVSSNGALAPLSFLAAPMMDEGKVVGVVRCCVVRSVPHYFTGDQMQSLGLIANQLGDWCGHNFRLHRAHEKRRWLESYVEGMSRLNRRAHEAAVKHKRDNAALYEQALRALAQAVPEAHSYCMRLADDDRSNLLFACHYPELEQNFAPHAKKIRSVVLPLRGNDGTLSAAADSFNQNEVVPVPDFSKSKYRRLYFENTEALIVAPVSSAEQKYGTIEVRFEQTADISELAVSAMRLLGRQLGLYIFLGDQIDKLRESENRLEATVREQQETFENLQHQLKTPVTLAHMKAKRIAAAMGRGHRQEGEMMLLKGLLRRAEQVASNVKLFGELARGEPIKINPVAATRKVLLERLQLAAQELNVLMRRQVRFAVEEETFEVLNAAVVYLDLQLLDQMVDNLLDNAGKYSTEPSTATIACGLTREDRYFFVSVANKGLPVTAVKARTLMQRGTRSDQALWGGQQGSGLGLYLVSKILEAHKGLLEIIPTDKRGITDFRLLFPVGPRRA